MLDGKNNLIKWYYIEELHKLQVREGLHLGNKLRFQHIDWIKKKTNVKLAAQLLSESVATSLQFCLENNLKDFQGCEATIKFIMIFNNLFDIFNSRNLCSRDFKKPIQYKNAHSIKEFLIHAETYIRELKLFSGDSVLMSNRKTGFLGFIVSIRTLNYLYDSLVGCPEPQLKYLMTYKMSQDNIELIFSQLRRMGGCNNNPTARQFSAAYKKIVVQNDLQDVLSSNWIPMESVHILTVSSNKKNNLDLHNHSVLEINSSAPRKNILNYEESEIIPQSSFHGEDYAYIPSTYQLSLCCNKIVTYIAGFVVRKLQSSLNCERCIDDLTGYSNGTNQSLIRLKSKGYLIHPSDDVVEICLCCEKKFRKSFGQSCNNSLPDVSLGRKDFQKIIVSVLEYYNTKNVFSCLEGHMYETEPQKNHLVLHIKAVAEKYLQVRYSYSAKQFSARLLTQKSVKSRHIYTKLIHFTGQ